MRPDPFADDVTRQLPRLRAFARKLTRNPAQADDLVQETVLRAWTAREKFAPGTNMRAWLFAILRNAHLSDIRKRRFEVEDEDGRHAGALAQKPSQESAVAMRDFSEAFAGLARDQKTALALVGMAGFTYEEAAGISGCAVGTVKSRVNRARSRLADTLGAGAPLPDDGMALAAMGATPRRAA